ncbi:electron transporter [Thermococcus sp. P6]|uniref:cytochrome C biogenesis protein CcdA n=1 Tax=Thermococcus sp. P6 TaxID=122420 RepID=UPI000B59C314|nr:cytochrome C biogenesis protein CcdA [Thermococcus sp. P6]ASJ10839.1 electron transporter [Thermococcus sp. P6]
MKGEVKGLVVILLASFGISTLALYLLGMVNFLPEFLALAMSDSINPCTFVVYTMLLIAISVREVSKKRLYLIGTTFIGAVYVSYYLLGVGLLYFAGLIPVWVAGIVAIAFGVYTVVTGLVERSRIGDKGRIRRMLFGRDATIIGALTLGITVSTTLLPCSAGSYLVYAILISGAGRRLALLLLGLYNLIFVLPLFVILLVMGSLVESKNFSRMMVRHGRELSVMAGMLLIAVGLWVLTGSSP